MTHRLHSGRVPIGVIGFILTAWVLLILIDVSPYAKFLSHHVIGEKNLSPVLSLALFQMGWLLMSVAMMLPGTLPTLKQVKHHNIAFWVTGYLAVWLNVGLLVYGSDLAIHTMLEPHFPLATLYLPTAVLLIAGIYQFTSWKNYSLSACRKPFRDARDCWDAMALGWLYGLACVGNCWAFMLVMTTLGTMTLAPMLLLGTFIAAEKSLRWRRQLAYSLGAALVSSASVMLLRTLRIA